MPLVLGHFPIQISLNLVLNWHFSVFFSFVAGIVVPIVLNLVPGAVVARGFTPIVYRQPFPNLMIVNEVFQLTSPLDDVIKVDHVAMRGSHLLNNQNNIIGNVRSETRWCELFPQKLTSSSIGFPLSRTFLCALRSNPFL